MITDLIYGTSITPSLLACFTWKRATNTGAVASICAGSVVTVLWKYALSEQFESPFLREVAYPAVAASVAALLIGSFATEPPPASVWRQFMDDGEGHAAVAASDEDDAGEEGAEDERALLRQGVEGGADKG